MLNGLVWLLGCQLVGELVARTLDLPVPGPVIGMVLLFVTLQGLQLPETADVFTVSDKMLRHLQLFFIPAGAGIFGYLSLVESHALPIITGIVVSWMAALIVVGWIVSAFTARMGAR
ncbi:MAG: CidA/LrgA family protein [Nocardioides sp.]|nr:CidA/LrgA family protein [Nocardioides sp.]